MSRPCSPVAWLTNQGGPFTVVDVDTLRPIRRSRFGSISRAFYEGDLFAWFKSGRDYRVLDRNGHPVPRSREAAIIAAPRETASKRPKPRTMPR